MLRAIVLLLLLCVPLQTQVFSRCIITGLFRYPNGDFVTGKIAVSLARSTVTNTCVSPNQVLTIRQSYVPIVNGAMNSVSLNATPCLQPPQYYIVRVYDQQGIQLYKGQWNVPTTETADVSTLDVNLQ